MAETSSIEWTDSTWQPITGCSVVSPGCTNCYAMGLAGTRLRNHPSRVGLTRPSKAGPVWTGEVRLNEGWLTEPLRWRRPRKIFVCAHGDLFHAAVPDEWIDRVFAVMALCPQHTFQVLTKRSARMRAYMNEGTVRDRVQTQCHLSGVEITGRRMSEANAEEAEEFVALSTTEWPLANVWLGVSAEDQRRADERIPDLLATPAAVRFVSAEPLLGPIDFTRIACPNGCRPPDYCNRCHPDGGTPTGTFDSLAGGDLDWIIVGGESGPNARPMHPRWPRAIRDQCEAAGIAFHFKQWGAWSFDPKQRLDSPGELVWSDGCIASPGDGGVNAHCGAAGGGGHKMQRVGKKAAGRLLDGVEHNGMPEARHG